MTYLDILLSQLVEPFRIGLLVMLVVTAARTAHTVGTLVPLLFGIVFVAALIPLSISERGDMTTTLIAIGLVSNTMILLVVLSVKVAFARLSGKR
jgi:hypothetical protein